ncbi:MAG: ABC transporter substrate-binding protein [Anaerolineales bacterium]|nr:MAG: ABC transporter substrate-binding protein [Anaerolineales bacterium]
MKKLFSMTVMLGLLLTLMPMAAVAAPPAQGGEDYIVQADDWLSKLADKEYGNPFAWPAIVDATRAARESDDSYADVSNPDVIEVGWKLRIPSPEEATAFMEGYSLEGEEIVIYHFGDLSGPYAGITAPIVDGFNDGAAWVNASGGIRGATVRVEFADNAGQVEEAISVYSRFSQATPRPFVIQLYGSPETEALRERFAEDKIAVLTAGVSVPGLYPSAYAFGDVPNYADQFGAFLDWLVENWAEVKPPNAGDQIKVAFVTWDTAFGRGADTPETRAYAASKGVEVVSVEFFPIASPDVTTQLLAAQAAGANVIYSNTLAHGPAQIMKDAEALGLKSDMLLAGVNWTMDLSALALAGAASEGWYGVMPTVWWSEGTEGIAVIERQFVANNRPMAEHNVGYLIGFSSVDAIRKWTELALDQVDGDLTKLDGELMYEVIQANPISPLGIFNLTFSSDLRAPQAVRIGKMTGGDIVPITGWFTAPDLRPAEFK